MKPPPKVSSFQRVRPVVVERKSVGSAEWSPNSASSERTLLWLGGRVGCPGGDGCEVCTTR